MFFTLLDQPAEESEPSVLDILTQLDQPAGVSELSVLAINF